MHGLCRWGSVGAVSQAVAAPSPAWMPLSCNVAAGSVHGAHCLLGAILTKDKNIRRDSLELRAVLTTKAYYFTLGKADRSAREMGEIILCHRPTIE